MASRLRSPRHPTIVVACLLVMSAATANAFFWSKANPTPTPTATPTSTPAASPSASFAYPTPTPSHTPTPRATPAPLAQRIVGDEFDLIAFERASFSRIGSRYGIGPKMLARENGKQITDRISVGDVLHIDNRHIVPLERFNGLLVNLPERMLFHFESGRTTGAYPIALGQPAKKWQTPTGTFKVIQMREDPTWRVPASIQQEMEEEGKDVIAEVEPGPDNPLGRFWIGLSLPVLGIHGTNHPLSIYSFRTHGCIRLHPDDIEALYDSVDLNDRGEIVYLPLMMARLDDGRIFLESQRDVYRRGTGGIDAVRALAEINHLSTVIDWAKAEQVVNDMDGIATDVTLKTGDVSVVKPAEVVTTTSGAK
jgi:L,D-transpeptidase ErfK/SrfK